jgi:nuclear autoantigenic sperm protein
MNQIRSIHKIQSRWPGINSLLYNINNNRDVLEVARVIYTKIDNKLALAEVHLTLGDLAMEEGNYTIFIQVLKFFSDKMEQAAQEYTECLALRQQVMNADDRKLAEVHYSIALANNFLNKNKEALTHFVLAKKILESRLTELNKTPEGEKVQIVEIKEIIAELQDKVNFYSLPCANV